MLVDLPQVNYKGEVAGPICLKMLRAAPKEGVTVALDSNVLTYVRLAILARGAVGSKSRQHPSKEGVPGKIRWLEKKGKWLGCREGHTRVFPESVDLEDILTWVDTGKLPPGLEDEETDQEDGEQEAGADGVHDAEEGVAEPELEGHGLKPVENGPATPAVEDPETPCETMTTKSMTSKMDKMTLYSFFTVGSAKS